MCRYLFFAAIAWVRGMFVSEFADVTKWSVSCEVSGPISDRVKMMSQGWRPYLFKRSVDGFAVSRFWTTKD